MSGDKYTVGSGLPFQVFISDILKCQQMEILPQERRILPHPLLSKYISSFPLLKNDAKRQLQKPMNFQTKFTKKHLW